MLQGDKRAIQLWTNDAGTLVEDFRVTRQLFLTDRVSRSISPLRYRVFVRSY